MEEFENKLNENESSTQPKDDKQQNNINPEKKSFLNKIWNVIKNNLLSSLLFIILIVFVFWSFIKMNTDKKQSLKDKTELTTKYEVKIDSIKLKSIEFSSMVFSWSVRSELIRNNIENLNQLFTVYVKESDATLIQLVDLKTNKIIISTDKQFEGNAFEAPKDTNLDQQFTTTSESKTRIYTPIMGFNNKIGLLVVEISK